MKVLCIHKPTHPPVRIVNGKGRTANKLLVEGEMYCVIDTEEWKGEIFYELWGIPYAGFNSKNFIPLSDIDETEMERADLNKHIEHLTAIEP